MTGTPRTRYALSGDAHIAYQVFGEGDVDLVFVPGFVSNIEHYWEMAGVPAILNRLGSFARVVIFDKRGTGLSDPVPDVPSLEQRMDDMQAVMDAVGLERASLFGISEGGPASVLFAATYPKRTNALVLYGSTPRFRTDDDIAWGATDEQMDLVLNEASNRWGEGALLEAFAPSGAGDPAMREVWGRFQRAGASPAMGVAVLAALFEIDVREILPTIQVPTLILHRTGDLIAPVEGARLMAEKIPNARYVEFEGDDHIPFTGDFGPVLDEMEEFLTGTRRPRQLDRVLATVMFTDIVDSTKRAAAAGDRRWRELLHRHDEFDQATTRPLSWPRDQDPGRWLPCHVRRPGARHRVRVRDPRRGQPARPRGPRRSSHGRVRARRRTTFAEWRSTSARASAPSPGRTRFSSPAP